MIIKNNLNGYEPYDTISFSGGNGLKPKKQIWLTCEGQREEIEYPHLSAHTANARWDLSEKYSAEAAL